MSIKWGTKSIVALAIASLTVGWQLSPIFASDSDSPSSQSEDQDWHKALRRHFQQKFFKAIDATKDQQDKLSGIFSDAMENNRGLNSQLKEKVSAIIDAFGEEKTSNEQLRQQAADFRALRDKLFDARLEAALKARAVLNTEQKKTLADKVRKRADFWLKSERS
jgi:Spy/CpxP family protein refolding chaperone